MIHLVLIIFASLLFFSSIGLSRMFFRHDRKQWFIHYFLGLPILSIIVTISSLLFSYPTNVIVSIVLISPGIITAYKDSKSIKTPSLRNVSLVVLIIFLVVCSLLLLFYLHSLLTPTGWDENIYHIPAMQEITEGKLQFPLLQGSGYHNFYPQFSLAYGNIPYASEAISSLSYGITSLTSSLSHLQFVHFIVFLFALYFLVKEIFHAKPLAYLVFILLALSTRAINVLISTSYVDMLVAAYQLISILCLFYALKFKQNRYLTYSLVMVGFSFSLKYPALFFVFIYAPIFLFIVYKLGFTKPILKSIMYGFIFNIFINSFWYVKNLILYRNPIYPFYPLGFMPTENRQALELLAKTQSDSRFDINISGFLESINNYYVYDSYLFVVVSMVALIILTTKTRWETKKYLVALLISSLGLYIVNFLLGNQVARYVVYTPIVLLLLLALLLRRNTFILVFLSVFALMRIWTYLPVKEVYATRLSNIRHVIRDRSYSYFYNNIRCSYDMVNRTSDIVMDGRRVLNLWDPYASVFYRNNNYFYDYTDLMSYDISEIPEQVSFVYVNKARKQAFINAADFHSGINVPERVKLENELIEEAELIYKHLNCYLYKLNEK